MLEPVRKRIELSNKLLYLLQPDPEKYFEVLFGGRGAGPKSTTIASVILIRCATERQQNGKPHKVFCCREIQNSIGDSVLATLKSECERIGLAAHFPVLMRTKSDRSFTDRNGTALGLRGVRTETRVRSRCTGKERDSESGLDMFGARYYGSSLGRFMTPDWSAKPQVIPYADPRNPQTLNLYSYVLNNPLTKIDPNGHDWFNVDGKWQWQKGHVYHDADGNATKDKGYAGLLVATATGTNKQGATTYSLTLYDQNKAVATGSGFSGGNAPLGNGGVIHLNAIADGNYTIRADIHNPAANSIDSRSGQPPPAYGIQPIPNGPNGIQGYDVYGAYGPLRAYMRPDSPGGTEGAYFHGQFDGFGYTHGCLSYGTDTRMIDYMYNNMHSSVGAAVDTPVEKP